MYSLTETHHPSLTKGKRMRLCLKSVMASVVTTGDITPSPPMAFALGDGPSRTGDNSGTLFIATPEPGQTSAQWLFSQLSFGNTYPDRSATTPPNLRNSPNPLYIGSTSDFPMNTAQPHNAADTGTPYDGVY